MAINSERKIYNFKRILIPIIRKYPLYINIFDEKFYLINKYIIKYYMNIVPPLFWLQHAKSSIMITFLYQYSLIIDYKINYLVE